MTNQENAYKDLGEFTKSMIEVLDASKDKYGDFTQYPPEAFTEHLMEEALEVLETLEKKEYNKTSREAIDVANMAFMIWWSCRNR